MSATYPDTETDPVAGASLAAHAALQEGTHGVPTVAAGESIRRNAGDTAWEAYVPGAGSTADASTTAKGLTKLSVAPVSASDPIAAGTNDTRLSDARTPVAHAHVVADTTALQVALDSKQATSEKGQASGYASLDGSGKVPASQMAVSALEYLGTWNASTNTPALADGTGTKGDMYRVSVAGTLGAIGFDVGDYAIHNGSVWEKADTTDAVSSVAGRTGAVVLAKADVGLGSVDNTADLAKPVSTSQQTALDDKQPLDSDLTAIAALTTTAYGRAFLALADAAAARTAIGSPATSHSHAQADIADLVADLAARQPLDSDLTAIAALATTATGRSLLAIADAAAGRTILDAQASDPDLTAIAALAPSNDDVVQRKAGAWTNRTPAQVKTDLVLVKADVGLGSADNTTDVAKPVSTAAQTALDLKQDASTAATDAELAGHTGNTSNPHGVTKSQVGLGSVDDTSDSAKPVSTAQQTALDGKQGLDADLTALAALVTTAYGRSLLEAATAAGARTLLDAAQAVHTHAQADITSLVSDLAAKQPLDSDLTTIAGLSPADDSFMQRKASAWIGRTAAQAKTDLVLVKGDVGLGSADNTADAAKPVSTAQQTALDAKAPLASPALTGNPTAPTPATSDSDTSIATTAMVQAAILAAIPITVRKTADETVNNSTTLQNDDHLVLAVEANRVYSLDLVLLTSAANTTADWKFGWTVPAGTTMRWGVVAGGTLPSFVVALTTATPPALVTESASMAAGSAAVDGGYSFRAIVVVAGTAGNVQFQWAQNTADVSDSKILTNSCLIATRLA